MFEVFGRTVVEVHCMNDATAEELHAQCWYIAAEETVGM